MGLLIAWALFEATSQVRARFMNWCRGKPKRESKAPSSLISADSAIWSAKENGTPTIVINETVSLFIELRNLSHIPQFVNPSTPAPEILHPSPSPSAIVAYYIRPDNLATPNPAYDASRLAPAHVVSPVSLDYYECMASPIPDVQATSDRNQVAKESTLRAIEEWRVKMAKGRPSTRPAKRI